MVPTKLSIVCVSFLLLYKFIDCEEWERGGISGTLESTDNVKIKQETKNSEQSITRDISTKDENIASTFEIPKFIEYQGRIVTSPPKPGGAAVKTIKYKLGNRVLGDHLVASNVLIQQWPAPQNVTQNLSYPRTGTGSFITYIEIIVEQSLNSGRAFVTRGGIGQRQIAITIDAPKTTVFRQNVQIYGY